MIIVCCWSKTKFYTHQSHDILTVKYKQQLSLNKIYNYVCCWWCHRYTETQAYFTLPWDISVEHIIGQYWSNLSYSMPTWLCLIFKLLTVDIFCTYFIHHSFLSGACLRFMNSHQMLYLLLQFPKSLHITVNIYFLWVSRISLHVNLWQADQKGGGGNIQLN